MLALIRMDWTLQRRSLLRISPLLLLWLAMGVSAPESLAWSAFLLGLFMGFLPLFPYLGARSLEPLLWALPVSRPQIVAGRYFSALLGLLPAVLLPLLLGLVLSWKGCWGWGQLPVADWAPAILVIGLGWAGLLFLYLPFHFAFGGERGMGWFLRASLGGFGLAVVGSGLSVVRLYLGLMALADQVVGGRIPLGQVVLGVLVLGLVSLGISLLLDRRRAEGKPMRRRFKAALGAGVILVLGGFLLRSWAPVSKALEEKLTLAFPADGPEGAVLAVRDGKQLLRRGLGRSGLPDGAFPIGSLTKAFTAALVLQEAEAGHLALDHSIRDYVPEVPEAWSGVTVGHCLRHMGGLPDYTGSRAYRLHKGRRVSPGEILDTCREEPLAFAPGTSFAYSNTGYLLLGMALERVTGERYGELLQARICRPLKLAHTGYGARGATENDISWAYSAGGVVSTVDDMARWCRALFGGQVLGPASLALLTEPGRLPDGRSTGYGSGWGVRERGGRTWFSHAGRIPPFTSFLAFEPAKGNILVVLAAGDPKVPSALGGLQEQTFQIPPTPRRPVTLAAPRLEALTGNYQLEDGRELVLRRAGDALVVDLEGQKLFFTSEGPGDFFMPGTELTLHLDLGIQGHPTGGLLCQDGVGWRVIRHP